MNWDSNIEGMGKDGVEAYDKRAALNAIHNEKRKARIERDKEKKAKELLEYKAGAAAELKKRYVEEKISFYKVCSPKHMAFHMSDKPIRVVFGPNQCGKTIMGLIELLFHACLKFHPFTKKLNVKKGRYRLFTTDFKKAEEQIIPLLKEWVPKQVLRGASWDTAYDSRYHMLHLRSGTFIDILTYDQDPAVAESVTLDGIWADEEMPERFYSGSLPRLMARNGRIWLTVTPLYHMSWALKFWTMAGDKSVEVFKLGFDDNPHLNADWKQTFIDNTPEHERAARLNGEFLEFSGIIYKELDSQLHFINESRQPLPHYPVIMTMDPHPRKATVMTWTYVDEQESLVVFDELEMRGTAAEIAEVIRQKEACHNAPTSWRIIDPAAKAQGSNLAGQTDTLWEFQKEGLHFSLANNNQDAGMNVVHEYLQYDKTKPVSSLNRPRLYFTKDAPKTWEAMGKFMWDEWSFRKDLRDEKERVKDYKKDFPDCVRYTVIERPNFQRNARPVVIKRALSAPAPKKYDIKADPLFKDLFPNPFKK